jgi:hypothetical protein
MILRGSLIGGSVGFVLALLRGRKQPGFAGRAARSTAEGAVAGAGVGWLLQRRHPGPVR